MESILDFAKGPLFRLTFALMAFGLLRIFLLDLLGIYEAYKKAGDKNVPWGSAARKALAWLLPIKRIPTSRPIYSTFSIIFHIGLIIVPIFLSAHVLLWQKSTGISYWALSQKLADILTLMTIFSGLALFLGRLLNQNASLISRFQDYFWPLILIVPFVTGFICANIGVTPKVYQFSMLIHVLSGELIFVLIPFTKIAHCIIIPFSQFVSTVAWKFPPNTDEAISRTMENKGAVV